MKAGSGGEEWEMSLRMVYNSAGPRKKSLLVQLVMGPAKSDCWLFWRKGEGNKDNILLKYRELSF